MRHTLFVLLVMVFIMTIPQQLSYAQKSATASAVFHATVAGTVQLEVSDGTITDLAKGYTYTLDSNPNAGSPVSPIILGSESGTPMEIEIASDPGTNIELSLTLPSSLVCSHHSGVLPCSFSSDGLYWRKTGQRFNPYSPVTIQVGNDSVESFLLGIIVTVPPDISEGEYTGAVNFFATLNGL